MSKVKVEMRSRAPGQAWTTWYPTTPGQYDSLAAFFHSGWNIITLQSDGQERELRVVPVPVTIAEAKRQGYRIVKARPIFKDPLPQHIADAQQAVFIEEEL